MKVWIEDSERYPDYYLVDEGPTVWGAVEVTEATHERWKRVIAEYNDVQIEIDKLVADPDKEPK